MANRWFPRIEANDGARKLAKQGAIGVLIFTAMNVAALLSAYYLGISAFDRSQLDAQGVQFQLFGGAVLVPLLLFFAYRVYTVKGWFVSGLVLAWFILEITMKVAKGTTSFVWFIPYIAIAAAMLNGVRACWWLRNENRTKEFASDR